MNGGLLNFEEDDLKNILRFLGSAQKKTTSMIRFLDKHDGSLIFLATFALAIITFFYLVETHKSRELIEEDMYRRSLPVMVCNNPVNEKHEGKVITKIKVTNHGASAFNENIVVFWFDDDRPIFENRAVVIIEGARVPAYRLQLNHPPNVWREVTLGFSNIKPKINNLNDLYLLVIVKYKVPLSEECLFEKFCCKYEPEDDVGKWKYIPISKVEELYEKARTFTLDSKVYSKEVTEEIETFLKEFFQKKL